MRSEQTRAVVSLARALARSAAGGGGSFELVSACHRCVELGNPPAFARIGLAVAVRRIGSAAALGALPDPVARLLRSTDEAERGNRALLAQLDAALRARDLGDGLRPVLLEDPAVALGVYGTLAALPLGQLVIAAEPGEGRSGSSTLVTLDGAVPLQIEIGPLGRLAAPVERHAVAVAVGERTWRVPSGELLATLLAARVGDPLALPTALGWFHLGVLLLTSLDSLDPVELIAVAESLGVALHAQRGLSIVAGVFPELSTRLPMDRYDITRWERLLGAPVTTRRIVRDSLKLLEG